MTRCACSCWTFALLVALCCLVFGCASPMRDFSLSQDKERLSSGIWVFRHKVRLEMPGRNIAHNFDGMMRLDLASRTVHAVALAGMGIQLFDVAITEKDIVVHYIHPLMRKIPGATDHIAFCLRRIWFDCLAVVSQPAVETGDGWRFTASGNTRDAFWPDIVLFTHTRDNYTLTIRLLQAQREDMP